MVHPLDCRRSARPSVSACLLALSLATGASASNIVWVPPETVSDNATENESFGGFMSASTGRPPNGPTMVATSDGEDLYIVWKRQSVALADSANLYIRHWNASTGWQTIQQITTHGGNESRPSIALSEFDGALQSARGSTRRSCRVWNPTAAST
jgi:hypothetical protein